jgi:Uma2 family endonuclease
MTRTIVLGEPPVPLADWLAERRALGQDLYDELWDGEYHVVPVAHSRHGDVQMQVAQLLWPGIRSAGLWASGPVNIGDSTNYRVPDGVVLRDREPAVYKATAAIVYEIVSPNDESYAKFGFYFDRGVEELLVVDPARRTVEWYTRGPDAFVRASGSTLLGVTEDELTAEIDWPTG